jgi:hypothetical protein
MALFLGVLKGFDKNECPARFDIMKTFITTLSLCLATSLFAGDKEAELKKRIAGYDASIASARKNLSDLYAKQGALRKDDLAIKRKQIEAKKAEIAKRRITLEAKKKPPVKKPISKEEYLKRAAAKKKAAAEAAKKKAGQKKPSAKKPISKAEYLKLAAKKKAAAQKKRMSKEEYYKLAAKKKAVAAGKTGASSKATKELIIAKKEYQAAQARLKKAIEAYKKSSGGKRNNGVMDTRSVSLPQHLQFAELPAHRGLGGPIEPIFQ